MKDKSLISTTEYELRPSMTLVGAQMMFVAFGALVLVPLLTGLDPRVALFTAGAGTLVFQICTKGKVPIFLASSFAFIAPIIYGVSEWGIPSTMCGLAAAGLFYVVLSFVIRIKGSEFLHKYLPPIVTGPVIMVIGLILAPVGVNMARGLTGDGGFQLWPEGESMIIAAIALLATILISLLGKGMFRLIPILLGAIIGYIVAFVPKFMGGTDFIDFGPVRDAAWFTVPAFVFPEWNLEAIIYILPVAIAPAIEHFGDIIAISGVTGKDYLKDPGIENTMLGDGIATTLAGLLGGPPNTTYSEVTGAVTLTRAFNPAIMTIAAIFAILLSFIGKLGALLQTIPTPVMGGILILLFGAIMVVGLNSMVRAGDDLTKARNLIIVSMILVLGIGGMVVSLGKFTLGGIGLAGVVGVLLNLILPAGSDDEVPAET